MSDAFEEVKDPSVRHLRFPCIKATQPVGDMYIASIPFRDLEAITYFDVRRVMVEQRDVERYLGIQRPLNASRVQEISSYVRHVDASFPTSIIIALEEDYTIFDPVMREMTVSNVRPGEQEPTILFRRLARVLDGQHRIAGLKDFNGAVFDLTVTVFVGADISDQAQIFATVNLEQNKVNKSLVYDLFELAKSRSPQKTCHNIAVALDRDEKSPLFQRIKRLGIALDWKPQQAITQATFVEALIGYISAEPKVDRDILLRGKSLIPASGDDKRALFLRDLFIKGDDIAITRCLYNYLSAIRKRWPEAWDETARGAVLNRTNGFKALMRFFRVAHNRLYAGNPVISEDTYLHQVFYPIDLKDRDFTVENFPPGSSGESLLYRSLRSGSLAIG